MEPTNHHVIELKKIRKNLGTTQEDFAKMVGVTLATLNRWELGKTKPSKLARERIKEIIKRGIKKQNRESK